MLDKKDFLQSLLVKMHLEASPTQLDNYLTLLKSLFFWNKKVNLTAIQGWDEAFEKHIADSLTLCTLLQDTRYLLDIGSGPGFPTFPVKIACPQIKIYSVEASRKKVHFQRHVARQLGLEGLTIIHCRVEDLGQKCPDLPLFDVIVSRALASLPEFLHLARPYLAPDGRAIAMQGPGCEAGLRQVLAGGDWSLRDQRSFILPLSESLRKLLVLVPNAKDS